MTFRLCCTLMLMVALACSASAQMDMGGGGGGGGAYVLDDDEKNLKFAGMPVPGYSDVMGFNLGVVAMVYYKMDRYDDDLPPSTTGVFGFYSENNTWMGGLFQKFYLDQDKWRITAALGTGSFKYQFNPASIGPGFPDVFVDYSTATNFLFVQGSRRAWGKLYIGLGAMSWSAKVKVEPDLIETEDERYTGPGAVAEWDHRDYIMNPRKGYLVEGRYLLFRESLGSARDFEKLNWSASGFTTLGDTTRVLAGRVLQEAGFGDVPFSAQSIVNGNRTSAVTPKAATGRTSSWHWRPNTAGIFTAAGERSSLRGGLERGQDFGNGPERHPAFGRARGSVHDHRNLQDQRPDRLRLGQTRPGHLLRHRRGLLRIPGHLHGSHLDYSDCPPKGGDHVG